MGVCRWSSRTLQEAPARNLKGSLLLLEQGWGGATGSPCGLRPDGGSLHNRQGWGDRSVQGTTAE